MSGTGKPVQALRQRTSLAGKGSEGQPSGLSARGVGSGARAGNPPCAPNISCINLRRGPSFFLCGSTSKAVVLASLFFGRCSSIGPTVFLTLAHEYHRHIDSRSFIINETRSQSELAGPHTSFGLSALRLRPAACNCQSVMGFVNPVHPISHIWILSP